jgi:hypothetical protein
MELHLWDIFAPPLVKMFGADFDDSTILFFLLGEEYQINGQTSWCGDDFQWRLASLFSTKEKKVGDGVLTTHKNVLDKVMSSCVKDNVSCSTYQDRLRKFLVAKTLSTLAAPLIKRSTVNKNKNVKNIIHQEDYDFQDFPIEEFCVIVKTNKHKEEFLMISWALHRCIKGCIHLTFKDCLI